MKKITYQDTAQAIKTDFLERARNGLFEVPYPGYPDIRYSDESSSPSFEIPDGPWVKSNLHAALPTPAQQVQMESDGITFDTQGRPLHPWLEDMITDNRIGVIAETGNYWKYGNGNQATDPITVAKFFGTWRTLLIQRKDTHTWAIPGGFLDDADSTPVHGGLRERKEETHMPRWVGNKGTEIYHGIIGDKRTTAHGWCVSHAILFRTLFPWPFVWGGDDAEKARWKRLDKLPKDLVGSHRILLELTHQVLQGEVEIEAYDAKS
jgi:ADP-ribose pyrophosphatase YjhB (NUDIX family)